MSANKTCRLPVGRWEKALAAMDRDLLELVDEFAWILEDTAELIAGRAVAAMTRYRQQLLPPLFSALMKYSDIHDIPAAPRPTRAASVLPTPAGRSTMTTMVKSVPHRHGHRTNFPRFFA
ncbi:hypothetical protein ACVXG7_15595 [Enterobacter hormaechei]